jgi:uncharacterized protein YndB with AHSA1/START domain
MAQQGDTTATEQGTAELFITRVFNAPLKLVWRAWSEPKHFMRWWGPKDFTSPVCKMDFRVGGKYLACMRSPDGKDYYSSGVYREIVPMERIVYTDSFADEKGNPVPPSHYGFSNDNWAKELIVTVTFSESAGKTTMTLRHSGFPKGQMTEMAEAGWNQSFDKLAANLK